MSCGGHGLSGLHHIHLSLPYPQASPISLAVLPMQQPGDEGRGASSPLGTMDPEANADTEAWLTCVLKEGT